MVFPALTAATVLYRASPSESAHLADSCSRGCRDTGLLFYRKARSIRAYERALTSCHDRVGISSRLYHLTPWRAHAIILELQHKFCSLIIDIWKQILPFVESFLTAALALCSACVTSGKFKQGCRIHCNSPSCAESVATLTGIWLQDTL